VKTPKAQSQPNRLRRERDSGLDYMLATFQRWLRSWVIHVGVVGDASDTWKGSGFRAGGYEGVGVEVVAKTVVSVLWRPSETRCVTGVYGTASGRMATGYSEEASRCARRRDGRSRRRDRRSRGEYEGIAEYDFDVVDALGIYGEGSRELCRRVRHRSYRNPRKGFSTFGHRMPQGCMRRQRAGASGQC